MQNLSQTKALATAELSNRIFFRLFQTANILHKNGTKALEDYGITTQQWSVLGALSRPQAEDGMTVGELCRFLMVSRQNLTGILTRLERQSYIERVRDSSDGRIRRMRLTKEGEHVWEAINPLIYSFYDHALHGLHFDDQVALLHYLNRLLDNMSRL